MVTWRAAELAGTGLSLAAGGRENVSNATVVGERYPAGVFGITVTSGSHF